MIYLRLDMDKSGMGGGKSEYYRETGNKNSSGRRRGTPAT
jgi:hypothetical protein